MFAPLHASLPPFPIVVEAVDNIFLKTHVLDEWRKIFRFCEKFFTPIFNTLCLGDASDGDGRRSTLQLFLMSLQNVLSQNHYCCLAPGTRNNPSLQLIGQVSNFMVSFAIRMAWLFKLTSVMMQDYIHNIKKTVLCRVFSNENVAHWEWFVHL